MKRAFAWATFLVLAATGACDDDEGTGAHVLVAQRFDVAGACVDDPTSIDLVKGGSGALTCDATCIVLPSPPEGTPRIYVTTMCGPYPDDYDISGADPECANALIAFASDQGACGNAQPAGDGGNDEPADDGGNDQAADDGGSE